MRKLLFAIIFSLNIPCLFSQTITIEEMKTYEPGELVFGETVNDFNGNPCAMVIVDIPYVENMIFKGNIMGDVEYDEGEYYLFVPQSTKQIKYLHEDYYPGSIALNSPAKSNYIYRVSLIPDDLQICEESSWLVLDVKDVQSNPISGCKVLVDDDIFFTDENGSLELFLDRGIHDYTICHQGYIDYNQSVTLSEMPIYSSVVMISTTNGDEISTTGLPNFGNAFSHKQAQKAACFLTDKMEYELNLTSSQKQDVYEINYDYFTRVQPVGIDSEEANNLRYRNLSHVLDENQWMRFQATSYFLIPLEANNETWELAANSYYDKNSLFSEMTKSMSEYDGKNANSASYYQARGLGYRDAVNTHIASSSFNKSDFKPFSRLVTMVENNSQSKGVMSYMQRQNPLQTAQRIQKRQQKSIKQQQYRASRENHRKERAEVWRPGLERQEKTIHERQAAQSSMSQSTANVPATSTYTNNREKSHSVNRKESMQQSSWFQPTRSDRSKSTRTTSQSRNSSSRSGVTTNVRPANTQSNSVRHRNNQSTNVHPANTRANNVRSSSNQSNSRQSSKSNSRGITIGKSSNRSSSTSRSSGVSRGSSNMSKGNRK